MPSLNISGRGPVKRGICVILYNGIVTIDANAERAQEVRVPDRPALSAVYGARTNARASVETVCTCTGA